MKIINYPLFVIDLETAGDARFTDHPVDQITELAVYKINTDLSVEHIYDSLISHPEELKDKINSSWWAKQARISFEDLKDKPSLLDVWQYLTPILDNQHIVSWNMSFDFTKFLDRINRDIDKGEFGDNIKPINFIKLPCPMIVSSLIIKIEYNHYYGSWKWPRLNEASEFYEINLDGDGYDFHRAVYDTHVSALVVAEMIKRGDYKL